eukprot:symbB.v1.2.025717.t2/scaffold2509.1/size77380/4
MENSPSRPQSARGIPAAARSSSAPRCPSSQRGSSLPREPTVDGRGPPQRAASSIDCSSFDRAGNCPVPPHSLPSRTAYTRNILGGSPTPQGPPSSFGPGGIEDLGYKKVTPGQFQASLVQTVESLLQSKLSQAASTSQRKTVTKVSGSEGQLQRDISLPTMVDDLVLYTEPQDENDQKPGLGAVQPKGRAEVMQQWLRPDLPQASLRPERRDPIPRALQLRSSQAQDAEMEWSSLSDASRQAIRQWVAGQLGGRHCMLVLEQGCAETSVPPTSETSLQLGGQVSMS